MVLLRVVKSYLKRYEVKHRVIYYIIPVLKLFLLLIELYIACVTRISLADINLLLPVGGQISIYCIASYLLDSTVLFGFLNGVGDVGGGGGVVCLTLTIKLSFYTNLYDLGNGIKSLLQPSSSSLQWPLNART